MNKIEIYIDCDEVVADFMEYARKFFGRQLKDGVKLPLDEWNKLSSNPHLFRDLEVKDGAYELIDWLKKYQQETSSELYFLTALPSKNKVKFAAQDKVHWCNKYFPDGCVSLMFTSKGNTMCCAVCALEIRNKMHGLNDKKFQGEMANMALNRCRKYLSKVK